MTRDDAIHIVDVAFNIPLAVRRYGEDRTYHEAEIREAKRMAITALSQEEQSEWERDHEILKAYADGQESMKPCKDAISRQAVLDILDDMVKDYVKENEFDKIQGVAWVKVQKLPSVSTEKVGRWLETEVMQSGYKETWIKCNNCGYDTALLIPKKYCPNCGAKMEVEE